MGIIENVATVVLCTEDENTQKALLIALRSFNVICALPSDAPLEIAHRKPRAVIADVAARFIFSAARFVRPNVRRVLIADHHWRGCERKYNFVLRTPINPHTIPLLRKAL